MCSSKLRKSETKPKKENTKMIYISNPILAKQSDDPVHHLGITKSLTNILHSMYGDIKKLKTRNATSSQW
ncbi:Uridine phosphorylase [Dirofilaria immitis]